jgi:hypothetical protein
LVQTPSSYHNGNYLPKCFFCRFFTHHARTLYPESWPFWSPAQLCYAPSHF